MLIQFRVENHRSLRDEQVLSLVASSDKAGAHMLRPDGLGEALVPVVAIYGANASGKSNVLASLDFMRRAILDSQRRWDVDGTPREPFLLSNKAEDPSLYEVDIFVAGVRYRYGFQLSTARVEEEWLFAWPHGRKSMWFERDGDRFEFGKTLHGENDAIRSLTRTNSLFLSAAAQNNHATLLPLFRHFGAWQCSLMRRSGLNSPGSLSLEIIQLFGSRGRTADQAAVLRLLQDADTGIVDIRVEHAEHGAPPQIEHRPGQLSKELAEWSYRYLRQPPAMFLRHRSSDDRHAWLPLSSESAGTAALLDLAPHVIGALRSGRLLCIDELEASMHPALALRLVRMFNDPVQNPCGAQLVFATHDTNLLGTVVGDPVLRRDQVWFTEKDDSGATHLYPLTDFHPRKEENLERGYLQGRYGAIPFLGDLVSKVNGGEADGGGDDGEADDHGVARENSDGDQGA